jgi:hypothetical protein
MRVIRSRLIVRGAKSPLSCAEPCVHHVHSLLVDAALTVSGKSGAMYEWAQNTNCDFFAQ